MITLRDAVVSALTLDTFNRHADKVAMANCAQLINCLNSLFLAHEDKFVRTPVFHVFQMYAAHQGGQAVRAEFMSPAARYTRDGQPASFRGLNGSASLRNKELTVTVVNPDVSQPRESEISIRGAAVKSARITTLTHADMHAHNTFTSPDAVVPATRELPAGGAALRHTFPAASVTRIQMTLE
jgi:alpha-N-arabinofuranosidase